MGQPSADRDYLPGHARVLSLLQSLSLRRPKWRVRVVGTNGKGSTSWMVASAFASLGMKVGLYTSPHILAFNERIRIDGIPVESEVLNGVVERLMPRALTIGASYFEVATAAALVIFSAEQVDVEILEAGVGARLDATTAVDADIAVITPIGLDHQGWLGDSLELVAYEKSFAMEGCRWVVSSPQDEVVEMLLHTVRADLTIAVDVEVQPKMWGLHQQQNASLALQVMRLLMKDEMISTALDDRIKRAIEQTVVPGRMQKIVYKDEAIVWLDAAHNMHAIMALVKGFKESGLFFDVILVQTREDRNLDDAIDMLSPFAGQVVFPRAKDGEHVASVIAALKDVLGHVPQGEILVLGSFITVAAAMQCLTEI
ncbi:MAG: bifunctional folylpolyglutamate synthase/dihydrofolate synthase [Zetaproteobacteria bacterium]|nr:bifunctional folylpolyglutamate synthase/dihydrofolate synthase [Zetaproteobacteria bacterium]